MSSLNLVHEGEDEKYPCPEDIYILKTFAILRNYLEPDTKSTLEPTASSFLNLMPEKNPHYGIEGRLFSDLCIEIAEQIPYHHPSQIKFVELLAYIGMSEKLGSMSSSMIKGTKSRQFHRYQLLGEELRENLDGSCPLLLSSAAPMHTAIEVPTHMQNRTGPFEGFPLSYFVNFHAFAANLHEYRIFSNGSTWAIWALREAHEVRHKETGSMRDMYVLAAAQWILWYGQSFFKHIIFPGEIDNDTLRAWKPGPLYTGTKFLSLHRWQFWKDSFKNVASGDQDEEKGGYSQECRSVSAKAADIMDALEKSMTF